MNVPRRPGESRSAWAERAMRQSADDEAPGGLAQFFYDLTTAIGQRLRRFAKALDREQPALTQPDTDREEH